MIGLQKRQRHGGNRGVRVDHRGLSATTASYRVPRSPSRPRKITGRLDGRGPRALITLLDGIDGHVLAQIELQPDKVEVLRTGGVLVLEAKMLLVLADLLADNETLGPLGLDRLRVARRRIADALAVLE
jgi:hypothetical protein